MRVQVSSDVSVAVAPIWAALSLPYDGSQARSKHYRPAKIANRAEATCFARKGPDAGGGTQQNCARLQRECRKHDRTHGGFRSLRERSRPEQLHLPKPAGACDSYIATAQLNIGRRVWCHIGKSRAGKSRAEKSRDCLSSAVCRCFRLLHWRRMARPAFGKRPSR